MAYAPVFIQERLWLNISNWRLWFHWISHRHRCIDLDYEVVVIDDESATCNDNFYKDKANYHKVSITFNNIEDLFNNVDYVFHLAAESRIQPALENPELAIKTNVLGTCRYKMM